MQYPHPSHAIYNSRQMQPRPTRRDSMAERSINTSREVVSSGLSGRKETKGPTARKTKHRDESREIAADVGARVRSQRKQQGLTLEALAERARVSRAMISKVERSEKSPTLPVLVRIAKGLDVTLSSLLGAQPDRAEISISRAGSRSMYRDPESGFERELLSIADNYSGLEIVVHRIPGGKSSGVLPAYSVPTEKYIMVQEGDLVVHLADKDYRLAKGDMMHFEVRAPYSFSNPGRKTSVYYVVLVRQQLI